MVGVSTACNCDEPKGAEGKGLLQNKEGMRPGQQALEPVQRLEHLVQEGCFHPLVVVVAEEAVYSLEHSLGPQIPVLTEEDCLNSL